MQVPPGGRFCPPRPTRDSVWDEAPAVYLIKCVNWNNLFRQEGHLSPSRCY
jgi:hypothetical protein